MDQGREPERRMAHTDAGEDMQLSPREQYAGRDAAVIAGRVRLRTLVWIRWTAIAGQLIALLVVGFGLDWPLPIEEALVAVAASVVFNLAVTFRRPVRGRLREWEAAAYLAFDVLQLAVLLFLTGGLTNPFALLFLGPVTVSATVLTRRATVLLSGLVIACATALVFFHLPLPWSPEPLELPRLYIWGLWIAVTLGTLFLAAYIGSVSAEGRRMSDALSATQLALAREQQLSAVGGLAAAAAHELGSPLATIAVTVKELSREIDGDHPLADDIRILQVEADRCRDILAELGRAPESADPDTPYIAAPLSDVAASAAARHRGSHIAVDIVATADDGSPEPLVQHRPELLHGMGNVIQNAVQFAREAVSVEVNWDRESATVTVRDDGRGFPPAVLDRIGEPYISSRGHGHLGLGIFIAQTLLERTGATVRFANARDEAGRPDGAEVTIIWPRASLEVHAAAE